MNIDIGKSVETQDYTRAKEGLFELRRIYGTESIKIMILNQIEATIIQSERTHNSNKAPFVAKIKSLIIQLNK